MTDPHPISEQSSVIVELHIRRPVQADDDQPLTRFISTIAGITDILAAHGGRRLQLRSDGLTAAFDIDDAHHAINTAIAIQQAHGHDNITTEPVAIGVAAGTVMCLPPDNAPIGDTVDRARFLATTANVGAVLADIETISSAQLHQIGSDRGHDVQRRPLDYLSPQSWLPSPSTSHGVTYHEVIWDRQARGLRPDLLHAPQGPDPRRMTRRDDAWKLGRVRSWSTERNHGFILDTDGEFFYFDNRFLTTSSPPAVGSDVWFTPKPALIEGKNRVAATVVHIGGDIDAEIDDQRVVVRDQAGNDAAIPHPHDHAAHDEPVGRFHIGNHDGLPTATARLQA